MDRSMWISVAALVFSIVCFAFNVLVLRYVLKVNREIEARRRPYETEADRMTREWPWWLLFWHAILGHELTNSGPEYPSPVCRTCELERKGCRLPPGHRISENPSCREHP